MDSKRFTEQEIADFLLQAKEGASSKFLCDKYDFSTSTLRRWKERHDEGVRSELKKMESSALMCFLCLTVISIILAAVAGATCILLMLGYCVFYITQFRKKSSEFIIDENIFLSRIGRGANNAFYRFSWLFSILFVFITIYAFVNILSPQ